MAFPQDKAELLALFLESIVFGIFLTFFIILVAISFARDAIRVPNRKFVLSVATTMMALALSHLIVDFVRVIQGFATGNADVPPNPIPYYENVADPLHATKSLLYGMQTLLGDAVLVWRCYIVYNKSLYVLIPAGVVLLGNTALTALIVWQFLRTGLGANDYETGAWRFVSSFFIITMGLNICCTIAIVFRVWTAHRRVSSGHGRSLFPVIAVIVESGAIYTASVSSLVVTFISKSNGQFPALDLISSLVGVVFCLIVLQIHLQLRLLKPSTTFTGSRSVNLGRWKPAMRTDTEGRSTVAIHISEHAHTDQDSSITAHSKI